MKRDQAGAPTFGDIWLFASIVRALGPGLQSLLVRAIAKQTCKACDGTGRQGNHIFRRGGRKRLTERKQGGCLSRLHLTRTRLYNGPAAGRSA